MSGRLSSGLVVHVWNIITLIPRWAARDTGVLGFGGWSDEVCLQIGLETRERADLRSVGISLDV
jgi:hypothetical protein